MKTMKDLTEKVNRDIEADKPYIYDVAAEHSQIVDNVKHMTWFKKAVAAYITENVQAYSHLEVRA